MSWYYKQLVVATILVGEIPCCQKRGEAESGGTTTGGRRTGTVQVKEIMVAFKLKESSVAKATERT